MTIQRQMALVYNISHPSLCALSSLLICIRPRADKFQFKNVMIIKLFVENSKVSGIISTLWIWLKDIGPPPRKSWKKKEPKVSTGTPFCIDFHDVICWFFDCVTLINCLLKSIDPAPNHALDSTPSNCYYSRQRVSFCLMDGWIDWIPNDNWTSFFTWLAGEERAGAGGSWLAYNLGLGRGYSVLDVVKCFESVSGRPIAVDFVQRREGDVASSYSDCSLAVRQLEWKASRTLTDMCKYCALWCTFESLHLLWNWVFVLVLSHFW